MQNLKLFSWNVRHLNSIAMCTTLHEMMAETACNIACFQETKLRAIKDQLACYLCI